MATKKQVIDPAPIIEKLAARCLETRGLECSVLGNVIDMLRAAPTVDAVEVVRCKDCKHFTEGMAVGMCKRIPEKPILPVVYNHFCSFGERKDNDN